MTEWIFHTPGSVDGDLSPRFADAWHNFHVDEARSNVAQMRALLGGDPTVVIPYADPSSEVVPAERSTVAVPWEGFPARMTLEHGRGDLALEQAETKGFDDFGSGWTRLVDETGKVHDGRVRHHQDEYLEWEPTFDDSGRLVAVTFVAEGHDYWSALFAVEPDHVVEEFRRATGVSTLSRRDLEAPSDLFLADDRGRRSGPVILRGQYNWRHRHNQGPGIRHLSQRANSLGAEVNLAVTSSLLRLDQNGKPVPADPKRLLCCTQGGDPNRSSDPTIAAGAYGQVTDEETPKRFTLTDPIGLYIRSIDLQSVQLPDGSSAPPEIVDVQRGTGDPAATDTAANRILRLRITAPPGSGFTLGDMFIDGTPITRGAQLAKLISMHLLVDVWDADERPRGVPCSGGCCRGGNGILSLYEGSAGCGPGVVDAFPELILVTGETTRPPSPVPTPRTR
jgi:hypothetical protein